MSTIGPIEKVTAFNSTEYPRYQIFYDQQLKYKSKPRNFWDPLPYYRVVHEVTHLSGTNPHWRANARALPYMNELRSEESRCRQKAYGKLVDKVKEVQNGWGENLGQRKQTFEMMLLRISTLTQAARALKRGDIRGFCKALGTTKSRTRSKAKKASEMWLEYHFGWEPLYKDIYDGCRNLGKKLPWGIVSASSQEETWKRDGYLPGSGGSGAGHGRCVVKLSGVYHTDDPGLFLLNSLGVINPISIAWELVPFSFAVDWFIPVGQYLQGLTDFVGVRRSREFTTVFKTAEAHFERNGGRLFNIDCKSMDIRRSLGISVPKPTFKLYRGFSVVRGVTAIALLTGTLKSLG